MADEKRELIPVDPSRVKKNDLMAFTYYGVVTDAARGGTDLAIRGVTPGAPEAFTVQGAPLVAGAASADQFHKEVPLPLTKIIKIFIESHARPFTVCFVKKEGEERTLRGVLVGQEEGTGYTYVHDLDKPRNDRFREVDNRTIKWLIVDGVKYVNNSKPRVKKA